MDPLTDDVVDLLRTSKRAFTQKELAGRLSISRVRLHRALEDLRALGYQFLIDNQRRVSLAVAPDRMVNTEILWGLKTRKFARQLYCYQKIGSTNARAIELAEAGAPEGTVVVAEEQTKGRGRLGRSWHSAPRTGIWSSVVLRPTVRPEEVTGLSLLAALAFAETVEREVGINVQLKWPNDGLIQGKKVCGILIELSAEPDRVHYAVCGTGINVAQTPKDFPPSLRKTATSLAHAAGRPVDRLAFYRVFLHRFEMLYNRFRRHGLEPLLPAYRERSVLLGKKVAIRRGRQKISGTAVAIDETGGLVVKSRGRDVVVHAGEATLR
jgi:BirA family biotin operon repressor/biotin-[acetyl-CoA-carboxylase] ligase